MTNNCIGPVPDGEMFMQKVLRNGTIQDRFKIGVGLDHNMG